MTQTSFPAGLKPLLGRRQVPGDFWGALAAMLVALPAAIAFGVTVYSAIAPSYAAIGALAGIIGATVIGLVASTLGGTDRLISAPCAPAAAVLSAFAIELTSQGVAPGACRRSSSGFRPAGKEVCVTVPPVVRASFEGGACCGARESAKS